MSLQVECTPDAPFLPPFENFDPQNGRCDFAQVLSSYKRIAVNMHRWMILTPFLLSPLSFFLHYLSSFFFSFFLPPSSLPPSLFPPSSLPLLSLFFPSPSLPLHSTTWPTWAYSQSSLSCHSPTSQFLPKSSQQSLHTSTSSSSSQVTFTTLFSSFTRNCTACKMPGKLNGS